MTTYPTDGDSTVICYFHQDLWCNVCWRLVVAKHDYIDDDVFIDTEFLPISDYLPQCDIVMEMYEDEEETYSETDYELYSRWHI